MLDVTFREQTTTHENQLNIPRVEIPCACHLGREGHRIHRIDTGRSSRILLLRMQQVRAVEQHRLASKGWSQGISFTGIHIQMISPAGFISSNFDLFLQMSGPPSWISPMLRISALS